ncbi:MAG TPA: NADH-quinone oxidoreductase subunit NuoH [Acidimicrobiia bacterium]|nr:NADH-quinone oxidoreductase subunit NuoH [Acidimicrobiia bacterium]
MDWADIGIVVFRVVLVFVLLLGATIINVWAERKVLADMQSRIGPNRAGPWGILQTVADGLKLFFKESITPRKAELATFMLAPFLAVIPAFLIFLMVPFGAPFMIGDREVILQGADLNIGLLFILAMSSLAVYSVVLAGWSSGSKYPLIGGIRATAQAISYEAAMGLAMVAVVMFTATQGEGGTLSLAEIVARQEGTWVGFIPRWNVFPQIVAFVIFMTAIVAETNRAPFDLVEAEQEIVGGFHTEYSGMRFAMFFLAEYINIFSMSAIAATLFLGGWNGPTWEGTIPAFLSALLPTFWFLLKTYLIVFIFFWLRATLPRLRYDQLMSLGWKRLIPVALAWIVVSAVTIGVRQFGLPWS